MQPKRRWFEGKIVLDYRTCICGKYEFCNNCERSFFPWGRSYRNLQQPGLRAPRLVKCSACDGHGYIMKSKKK